MAEDSAQERTLPATPRRLQKAREEGQIVRSRELASTAVLAGAAIVFVMTGAKLYRGLSSMLIAGLSPTESQIFHTGAMLHHCWLLLEAAGLLVMPLFAIVVLCGLLGGVAIGGWSIATNRVVPDLSRLNPVEGVKRLASGQGVGELLKSILKLVVVSGISGVVLWAERGRMEALLYAPSRSAVFEAGSFFGYFFLYVAAATALVLVFDVPFQIRQYGKQLRMTPQEVREEMKETEGHPDVKRRVRKLQQDRARGRMMSRIPDADIIITNPTHFAVALSYEPAKRSAPIVVAKGANAIAQRIRELGKEHGIPVLESPRLARALYRHVPLEAEVPGTLYQAVAQVLAYVYKLNTGQDPDPPSDIDVPEDLLQGEAI